MCVRACVFVCVCTRARERVCVCVEDIGLFRKKKNPTASDNFVTPNNLPLPPPSPPHVWMSTILTIACAELIQFHSSHDGTRTFRTRFHRDDDHDDNCPADIRSYPKKRISRL